MVTLSHPAWKGVEHGTVSIESWADHTIQVRRRERCELFFCPCSLRLLTVRRIIFAHHTDAENLLGGRDAYRAPGRTRISRRLRMGARLPLDCRQGTLLGRLSAIDVHDR